MSTQVHALAAVTWAVSAPLLRKPWLALLAIVGVALGASVVVAIDLSATSARAAQVDALAAQHGRASHRIVGGPAGLPEQDYVRIAHELPHVSASPVIELTVAVPALGNADNREPRIVMLGIDAFQMPVGRYLPLADATTSNDALSLFTSPRAVLLGDQIAQRLPESAGDTIRLRYSGAPQAFAVAGQLSAADGTGRLLLTDIATAQEFGDMVGRLSYIELANVTDADVVALESLLSPGASVVASSSLVAEQRSLSQAFETNLQMMGLVALLVGLLLVYNTVIFTVIQRREQLGVLRCLGVTRREIFVAILLETTLIGSVAAVAGVMLGYALADLLLGLVTQTLNDLYFSVEARTVRWSHEVVVKGALTALVGALGAALVPAWEACRAPPAGIMRRSSLELAARARAAIWAAAGLAVVILGVVLLYLPALLDGPVAEGAMWSSLEAAFIALFLVVLGAVLTVPWVLQVILPRVAGLVRLVSPIAGFAVDGVRASASRTSVAVAALAVALAATIGVGVMIDSFRTSVTTWLQVALQADIYISRPGAGPRPTLPPALEQAVRAHPGVRDLSKGRSALVRSGVGNIDLIGLHVLADSRPGFVMLDTGRRTEEAVWEAFAAGAVFVTEPFANRHGVRVGGRLKLQTPAGWQTVQIAAVYRDYGREQGVVVMDLSRYRERFGDLGVSSLGLYLHPDSDLQTTIVDLRPLVDEAGLRIQPTRAIREASIKIFDRTFAITQVLRAVTVVVAFVGVLSALMALQLERARELAVLRATGVTRVQVFLSVITQTSTMGLAAGLLALPLGAFIGYVLVTIVNTRSFGWTLEFQLDPNIGAQALLVAVLAAAAAGLYPAVTLARRTLGQALRHE